MFFKFLEKNKKSGKVRYIIAGLGNPGEKYLSTRHNAGFLALDHIAKKYDFKINTMKFKSLCARHARFQDSAEEFDVLFLKPQTYMNNSGEAVSEAARFYKVPPENILVISDDINLPLGKLRIRKGGSDGGQKGLRSIGMFLSSENFPRVRVGVGEKPHPDYDAIDWVLSKFSKDEEKIMAEAFEKVCGCAEMFIAGAPIELIQNKYN